MTPALRGLSFIPTRRRRSPAARALLLPISRAELPFLPVSPRSPPISPSYMDSIAVLPPSSLPISPPSLVIPNLVGRRLC
ncbi:hypothetical protein SEVIR_9G535400v4 [Setaria viridis]